MSSGRPRAGETVRGYARRVHVSYRQARRIVLGKVYERDVPTYRVRLASPRTHGEDRAVRRRKREIFWTDLYRQQNPDERRSRSQLIRDWRRAGMQLPRRGTHGTHAPSQAERVRIAAFLEMMGLRREEIHRYQSTVGPSWPPNASFDPDTGY